MSEQEAMELAIGRTPIHDVTDSDLAQIWEAAMQWRDSQAGEPVGWRYKVNNTHILFSETEPPNDAYDEGSLVALYTAPPAAQINQQLVEALEEAKEAIYNAQYVAALQKIEAALEAAKETK